jgi:hypothetical protein
MHSFCSYTIKHCHWEGSETTNTLEEQDKERDDQRTHGSERLFVLPGLSSFQKAKSGKLENYNTFNRGSQLQCRSFLVWFLVHCLSQSNYSIFVAIDTPSEVFPEVFFRSKSTFCDAPFYLNCTLLLIHINHIQH